MSHAYDVMSKAWARLQAQLPATVRDGEVAARFGMLIETMHDANHDLGDAINKHRRVTAVAVRLDRAMDSEGIPRSFCATEQAP